jgi:hypothetical protein
MQKGINHNVLDEALADDTMSIDKTKAPRLYGLRNLTMRSRMQNYLVRPYDTHAARVCQVGSHTISLHRERSHRLAYC